MHYLKRFLFLVLIAIALGLSYWQVQRAHEKEVLLTQAASGQSMHRVEWSAKAPLPKAYEYVRQDRTYFNQ